MTRISGFLAAFLTAALFLNIAPARAGAFDDALNRELAMIFDQRVDRAEAYVEWTYGWATSYVNSYHAAARVLMAFWKTPEAGWNENFYGSLRTFQHEAITERVTRPKDSAAEISLLIDRYVAARLYLLQSRTVAQTCASKPGNACRATIEPKLRDIARSTEALRLDAKFRAQEASALASLFDFDDAEDVDLLHTARPITTRLIVLILRLTEFASLVVVISQSLRTAYVPDTVITRWIITLSVVWALDYAVLGVERLAKEEPALESLTERILAPRPAVEAYVHKQIAASEAVFSERATRLADGF